LDSVVQLIKGNSWLLESTMFVLGPRFQDRMTDGRRMTLGTFPILIFVVSSFFR
jgi:hypothetical protein